jgi:phasin family protein
LEIVMTLSSAKQILAEQKASAVAAFELADTVVVSAEQLLYLAFSASSSMLTETQESVSRMVAPKTPFDLFVASSFLPMGVSQKVQTYGRKTQDVVSEAQARFAEIVRDLCEAHSRLFIADAAIERSGSDSVPAGWKMALEAANGLWDALQRVNLQIVQVATSNAEAAAALAWNAGKLASEPAASRARR